jgi:hypothetical protein
LRYRLSDAAGHATFWNGLTCSDHCYFNAPETNYTTTKANFWELPEKIIASLLLLTSSASVYATDDPVLFVKKMPYKQVIKDVVFSRCLAQVSDDKASFLDAARSSSALLEWIPFDIENGNDKINALIKNIKAQLMPFILR